MSNDKVYKFTSRFGEITETDDADTPVHQTDENNMEKCRQLTLEHVRHVAQTQFIGQINQQVPLYSAVRVDGIRLYDYERNLKKIVAPPERPIRPVQIHSLVVERAEDGDPRDFTFLVHCSKGTYVRTLGADIAKACGFIGAHTVMLRRMKSGNISIEDAWTIEELNEHKAKSS